MRALLKLSVIVCVATAAFGFSLSPTDVVFHFFSRSNPTVSQPLLPNINSIMTSDIDINKPVVITIHNYVENSAVNFNAFVVSAHLNTSDENIIAVDWSAGAQLYTQGLGNAPQCGAVVASFVNILIQDLGFNTALLRIIGVGLGAHVAGIAARKINGPVPHITALDPSFFGWSHHPDILNPDDAEVVEVLHTTSGNYGYDLPLGDIDFYPNGGAHQAGCGSDLSCSHQLSYVFYAESITSEVSNGNEFVGTACEDYESAVASSCEGERNAIFGGRRDKAGVSGVYNFLTNPTAPFARG
ncbi:pancreatic triacylglycerol lipase-like [Galleria mellonella]|uniref:Pancreatic triacylglycerol lipase-like n=1 Tax=Galleria mellonella TaxID=7137 RepID=A0A6J1WZM7_GALME|nr:pancreatic triacylglycerol lipase-like [Galleria mellonella]